MCGNYSRVENIQGRKLFAEIRYLCMTLLEISEFSICLICKKIHSRFLGIKIGVQKDSKRYYEKNVPKWNQSMYLWRCMHSIKVSSFHYKEHSNMAYFHTQEWIDFFSFDWNWTLKIFNWIIQIMLLRTFYLFCGTWGYKGSKSKSLKSHYSMLFQH